MVEAELRDKDGFPLSQDLIQIGEIHRPARGQRQGREDDHGGD